MVKNYYKYLWLILLLYGMQSCMIDGLLLDLDVVEKHYKPYFISVTKSETLNTNSFLERLGADLGDDIGIMLPQKEMLVNAITYRSQDPRGNEVAASGIIAYPPSGEIKGVVIGMHYTISANWEAPSSMMATVETALALLGYVVIAPDYIGFGSTKNLPHPYLHVQNTGQVSVDMVLAAREYMETKGIDIGKEIYTVGYSQGGQAALAFAKLVQEKYDDKIQITKVFAGGGPYIPKVMFDIMVEEDYASYPCAVPLTVIGLDYGDNLGLDYNKIFIGETLTNYRDWFLSKDYTNGQLKRMMGSTNLSDFMHPDMFTKPVSGEFTAFYESLEQNNLINWKPTMPLLLVHGELDADVHFVNGQMAYDSFREKGCDVKFLTYKTDHHETATYFFLQVLLNIPL